MLRDFFFKVITAMPGFIKGPVIRNRIRINRNCVDNIIFKIATTRDELEQAYKIRHDSFVDCKYMNPRPSKLRNTIYDFLPGTVTFIGKRNDQVLLTMTLYPDSEIGVPHDVMYKYEFDQLRSRGLYIADVGSLASHKNFRNNEQNMLFYLNKIMYLYARYYLKADTLVIIIAPKLKWVYENLLFFKQIGELKREYAINNNRVIAMKLDLQNLEDIWMPCYNKKRDEKNLYKLYTEKSYNIELPENNLPVHIWTEELLLYFINKNSDTIKTWEKEMILHFNNELSMKKFSKTAIMIPGSDRRIISNTLYPLREKF